MSLIPTLVGLLALATSDPLPVDNFACLDQYGAFHRLSRHADAKLVVLYVFMNDCPIVRLDAGELQALATRFEPKVRFLGLDPASQDERPAIAAQAAELGLRIPILQDDTQCVAEMLEVTRSGEALVLAQGQKGWEVRWRGPLDDRLEYGAQKPEATRHFLEEALTALLEGQPAPEAIPPAKGCAITFIEPRERHEVDYVDDVAPILTRRCLPCHREGGIGSWAMDGYKRVRGFGAMMRDVLLERRMSPWQVDPLYGHFAGDFAMTPEEVRALVHWVENGTPRGKGDDPLAAEAVPQPEWPLGPPDLIVEVPEQEIPATGLIPYRDLDIALDLPEGRWVRALDLRPSNPEVLHHAFAFIRGEQEAGVLKDKMARMTPERRAQVERWLTDHGGSADQPPKEVLEYFKKLAFHGIYTFFSKYVPGEGIDAFPEGTGKFLPANPVLAFQMHYTTNGAATTDRPRLGIYFYDEKPPKELEVTTALNTSFVIEPGDRASQASAERFFDHPFKLYAVSPHMHYRGRSMRYTAIFPDGTREILFSLPEYAFDWQTTYQLAEPRVFPAGTDILVEGVFDNSSTNEYNPNPNARVKFGPRTLDEMFVAYLIFTRE